MAKKLDRKRDFGEVMGHDGGACFVQDETLFDADGNELVTDQPVKKAPAAKAAKKTPAKKAAASATEPAPTEPTTAAAPSPSAPANTPGVGGAIPDFSGGVTLVPTTYTAVVSTASARNRPSPSSASRPWTPRCPSCSRSGSSRRTSSMSTTFRPVMR